MKINDAHVHIGKSPEINQSIENLDCWKIENSVEKCLVFGFDDTTRDELSHRKYALKWCDNYVSGYYDKFYGVKFHGSYLKKPVTDKIFQKHMEYLNKEGKILLVHCGMFKDGDITSTTSFYHPCQIAELYPNIQVILGHMGGSVTPVVKKCVDFISETNLPRNLWLETSGITTPYVIEYAVENLGDRQILFGSDSPWCSFNAMVSNVVEAKIEKLSKELILYHNFNTLINRISK